jgi:hypothetical protein
VERTQRLSQRPDVSLVAACHLRLPSRSETALVCWMIGSFIEPAGEALVRRPWASEENLPTTLDEQQRPNRSGSSLVGNDQGLI